MSWPSGACTTLTRLWEFDSFRDVLCACRSSCLVRFYRGGGLFVELARRSPVFGALPLSMSLSMSLPHMLGLSMSKTFPPRLKCCHTMRTL